MNKHLEINDNPKVSVVMPLYNSKETVGDSIKSVLSQTLSELELIVVDDCSNDGSVTVVEHFAKKDNRVKLIKLAKNQGAGVARNIAIEAANGRYIAFLDADDQWYQNKLEIQIANFGIKNTALICSGYTIVDTEYQKVGQKTPKEWISHSDLLKSNVIGCLTAIYDTKKIGKMYMPNIRKRQDYALWLNIIKKNGPAYCVQDILAQYYIQPKSISSNKLDLIRWNYRMFKETQSMSQFEAGINTLRNIYHKIKNG